MESSSDVHAREAHVRCLFHVQMSAIEIPYPFMSRRTAFVPLLLRAEGSRKRNVEKIWMKCRLRPRAASPVEVFMPMRTWQAAAWAAEAEESASSCQRRATQRFLSW